jgi:hypothetical protein
MVLWWQECIKWWDVHLKGRGQEPPPRTLTVYMRHPISPTPQVCMAKWCLGRMVEAFV